MRKKAKIGTLVTITLVVPVLYVVLEYLRNWRYSINALVGKGKQGW